MVLTNKDLQAIGTLLDSLDKSLNARMDSLNESLNARMDSLDESLNARMDSLDESLNARMDSLDESLNARMDSLDKRMDSLDESLNARMDSLEDSQLVIIKSQLSVENEQFPRIAAALDGVSALSERDMERKKHIICLEEKVENHDIRILSLEQIVKEA